LCEDGAVCALWSPGHTKLDQLYQAVYFVASMNKVIPNIVAVLLGLVFLVASIPFLLNLAPMPKMPEGTPIAHFMAAFGPTGYFTFIKVFELVGGILVMIPRLRNIGLLILGPIIVNIIANSAFIAGPSSFANPLLIVAIICALFLLWNARAKFAGLLN
jgi:putative oxidoreductase